MTRTALACLGLLLASVAAVKILRDYLEREEISE